MTVECFLDTNVLIYAASQRPSDARKKTIAIELIQSTAFGISTQVLQEFYVITTRKAEVVLKPVDVLEWIEQLEVFPCAQATHSLVTLGAVMSERYGISYWDGAIVAAAESLGAPVLYTESLTHGQTYGAIRAINPFIDKFPAPGFHEAQGRFTED